MNSFYEDIDFLKEKYPVLPYLGYSDSLIDYFCIIGYEQTNVKYQILEDYLVGRKNTSKPTILNAVISNPSLAMLEGEELVGLAFPEIPQIQEDIDFSERRHHIFYLNSYDDDISKLNPFHGSCMTFYEEVKLDSTYDMDIFGPYLENDTNRKFYTKKAIILVSQYGYFSAYMRMNDRILDMFNAELEMPIEVYLYNLINAVPTPRKMEVKLNYFKGSSVERFNQLTGFPLMDLECAPLLLYLPPKVFLLAFYVIFLEQDIVFFSHSLKTLNYVMYTFNCLMYPLNDTHYSWHLVTISEEEFILSSNRFANKPSTSMFGVHSSYKQEFNPKAGKKHAFIVDIDAEKEEDLFHLKQFVKDEDSDEEVAKLNTVINYLKTIPAGMNNKLGFPGENAKRLYSDLVEFWNSKKLPAEDRFKEHYRDRVENMRDDGLQALIYYSMVKLIDDIKSLIGIHVKDNGVAYTFPKEGVEMTEAEQIFVNLFSYSEKYGKLVENYFMDKQVSDLFKIPLLHTECFSHMKTASTSRSLNHFDIINAFYEKKKRIRNTNINLADFVNVYAEYFAADLNAYNIEFSSSVERTTKDKNVLWTRKYVKIENKILLKYIYLLNFHQVTNKINNLQGDEDFLKIDYLTYYNIYEKYDKCIKSSQIAKNDNFNMEVLIEAYGRVKNIMPELNMAPTLSQLLEYLHSKANSVFLRQNFGRLIVHSASEQMYHLEELKVFLEFVDENQILPDEFAAAMMKRMQQDLFGKVVENARDASSEEVGEFIFRVKGNFCMKCNFSLNDKLLRKALWKLERDEDVKFKCKVCEKKRNLSFYIRFIQSGKYFEGPVLGVEQVFKRLRKMRVNGDFKEEEIRSLIQICLSLIYLFDLTESGMQMAAFALAIEKHSPFKVN